MDGDDLVVHGLGPDQVLKFPDQMPNLERLDHEISRIEREIDDHRSEAISALAAVVSGLTAAADLFYVAWRIERVVKRLKGPQFPAPGPGRAPYSASEQTAIKTAEDFYYKALGRLNDKIAREKDSIASSKISDREAFAAAAVRVLEQFGRNFRLRLKTNQGRVVLKLAADDVEFD